LLSQKFKAYRKQQQQQQQEQDIRMRGWEMGGGEMRITAQSGIYR